jgi:four helix bundle protein
MISGDSVEVSEQCNRQSFCYRDLIVWQRSMELCKRIYEITAGFPSEEKFGIVSQMRRAAVSIPSNISEGQGRLSTKEFRQFLGVARGSLRELETQTLISKDLEYAESKSASQALALMEEVSRMLNKLITSLTSRIS